ALPPRTPASSDRALRHARQRLPREVVDHGVEVPGLLPDAQLPVRARALTHDRLEVGDLATRAELVDDVIDKLEELDREVAHRHLALDAEVDEVRVHAPAHRAPLVLLDERGRVLPETEVPVAQHEELRADRLDEGREADRLVDARRRVAHAELDRRVEREEVREEVARLVHDLDPALAVGDTDVHVYAEDEELADDVLQLLLEDLVPLVLGDLLLLPVREGVRAGRRETQPVRLEMGRER